MLGILSMAFGRVGVWVEVLAVEYGCVVVGCGSVDGCVVFECGWKSQ